MTNGVEKGPHHLPAQHRRGHGRGGHAYVALSRAREQTQVYVAREDLGEQGMDVGAIERLGERMRRSGAQEASIAKEADERTVERQERIEREIDRDRDLDRGFGIE